MTLSADQIYALLPAIYRTRDAAQGEPLKALIGVIAEQVGVLERDLAGLQADQFIETCAPWVVPYIGDLIGWTALLPGVPGAAGSRAEVANTIGYRRRKGTLIALEQLVAKRFGKLAAGSRIGRERGDLRRFQPFHQPLAAKIGDRRHEDKDFGNHHEENGEQKQLARQPTESRRPR